MIHVGTHNDESNLVSILWKNQGCFIDSTIVTEILISRLLRSVGMILYTFIQFHSTPAIVTSVFIGLGIVFCGCAMVHNVFVWQKVSMPLKMYFLFFLHFPIFRPFSVRFSPFVRRPNGVRIFSIIAIRGSPVAASSPLYFLVFHDRRCTGLHLLFFPPASSLSFSLSFFPLCRFYALNLSSPSLISISRNGRCHYHAIIYVGDHSTV